MRERIEAGFGTFARAVIRRRWIAIAACLAIAAGLASQLPKMGVETAVETFLPESAPERIAFTQFREQFGREDIIIVGLNPPDMFDLAFLEKLRAFHERIENDVPNIDDVQSLVNARSTYGSGDELIVEDLLEDFPTTPEEVERVRERVLSTPMYKNTVISEDASFTSVAITLSLYSSQGSEDDALAGFDDDPAEPTEAKLITGAELAASLEALQAVVDEFRSEDFPIAIAGTPPLQHAVAVSMAHDLQRFVVLMIATIALVLFALFRRLSGVLLPLGIVVLSLISTMGALAASGVKLMPPTQILPTFLLSVGTGAAVHILKIFYLRYDAGDVAEDAIAAAFSHSGLAVVMTSLTTAGGLLSFLAAGLTPIIHLGIFGPFGVMLALLYVMVLLPAALSLLPLRRKPIRGAEQGGTFLERLIVRGGDLSVMHPRSVVATTVVVVVFFAAGAARLDFSNDVMSWLAPDNPVRAATELIDRELKGSITLELVADTGVENGVKQPAFLNGLEELRERTASLSRGDYLFVGKTIAISDILKEIHQALNENRKEFYAIPQDAPLVSQELLLFENTGTDDLEDVVDTRFQLARFTLKVPYVDPLLYDGFITDVEREFRAVLGDDVGLVTTGFMGMMTQTVSRVIRGMMRSYGLALAIITPLMILLIGSWRGGVVSMVPNLTPILITLGLMGWAGLTVDMFTMMIGSIAIGLAVDDTIHFIHCFRRDLERLHDARAAVRETLETTGRALLVTSVVLSSGFLIFTLSSMQNLFWFGLLTSFTIVAAFVIDILVTPAMVVLVTAERGES